jgi:hypothetical protein
MVMVRLVFRLWGDDASLSRLRLNSSKEPSLISTDGIKSFSGMATSVSTNKIAYNKTVA